MLIRFISTGVATTLLAVLGAACSGGSASSPNLEPSASQPPAPTIYAQSPVYRIPLASIAELVSASTVVAVVEVDAQLPDYWPAGSPQLLPNAQFRVIAKQVLAGSVKPGDQLTLRLPGGTIRQSGDPSPNGSGFRPQPGDKTTVIQYEDAPFPRVGTRELLFLTAIDDGSGVAAWGAIPEGRLVVDGAALRSPLAVSAPQLAGPGMLPATLSALSLDELGRRVAEAKPAR